MVVYLVGIVLWIVANVLSQIAQDKEFPEMQYIAGAIITGILWPVSLLVLAVLFVGAMIIEVRK